MTRKTDTNELLDRIEESRKGETLTDDDIKEFVMNKDTGSISKGQIDLSDELFIKHIKRFDDRVEKDIQKNRKINVSYYDGVKSYKKGFMKWTPEQESFVRERTGIKPISQIVYEYNAKFLSLGQARSKSSIKTKAYRVR